MRPLAIWLFLLLCFPSVYAGSLKLQRSTLLRQLNNSWCELPEKGNWLRPLIFFTKTFVHNHMRSLLVTRLRNLMISSTLGWSGLIPLEDGKTRAIFDSVLSDTQSFYQCTNRRKKLNIPFDARTKARIWLLKSPQPNAAVVGSSQKSPQIIISKGLLDLELPNILLRSIFAHELGHLQKMHNRRSLLFTDVTYALLETVKDSMNFNFSQWVRGDAHIVPRPKSKYKIISLWRLLKDRFIPRKVNYKASNFIHYLGVTEGLRYTLWLLQMYRSRCFEHEADAFAAEVYGPDAAILALQALNRTPLWLIKLQLFSGITLNEGFFRNHYAIFLFGLSTDKHVIFRLQSTHPSFIRRLRKLGQHRNIVAIPRSDGKCNWRGQ